MTLGLNSISHVCLVKLLFFFFPTSMMQPFISLGEKKKKRKQQMTPNSVILVEAPCCQTLGQAGLSIC